MSKTTIAALTLAIAVSSAAAPAIAETLRCAGMLTAAEVKAATGTAFEDMGPDSRNPGESECDWMARGGGGFKSVAFTFYELKAIEEALIPADSPAEFYDLNVRSTEEVAGGKGEKLPGIGVRAVLIRNSEQLVLYVERADGLLRIVTNGLTNEQATAVARSAAQ